MLLLNFKESFFNYLNLGEKVADFSEQSSRWCLLKALLRVTCIIFARMINTDVWQEMIACAIMGLRKTVVSHLNRPLASKSRLKPQT